MTNLEEKKLKALEQRIEREYRRAYKELKEEFLAETKRYEKLFEKHKDDPKKLVELKRDKLLFEKQARTRIDIVATRITNAGKIATAYMNDEADELFRLGYGTHVSEFVRDENLAGSLNVMSDKTIKQLILDKADIIPHYSYDVSKAWLWNKKHVEAEILQGIVQGQSIDKIASRLSRAFQMGSNSSIRAARTLTCSAVNSGHYEANGDLEKRLKKYGLEIEKVWSSAKDSRTRPTHRALNGKTPDPVTGLFSNGLRYPADPRGAPAEVYNCRCTITTRFTKETREMLGLEGE